MLAVTGVRLPTPPKPILLKSEIVVVPIWLSSLVISRDAAFSGSDGGAGAGAESNEPQPGGKLQSALDADLPVQFS